MDQPGLVAEARRAVDAAQERPADALGRALDLLVRGEGDSEVLAIAHWAAGLAQRELNRLVEADASLVLAVAAADAGGHDEVAAGARTSRALALVYLGRPDEGLAELDAAEQVVSGTERARVQMQRALILQRQGRLAEALRGYADALPGIVAGGDRVAEVRLRVNRGIAFAYQDALTEADLELRTARALAQDLGQTMQAAACAHNLGFVHGRRGDVPESLRWFDHAAHEYADLDVASGLSAVLLVDRATVLLDAALADEALALAEQAVALLAPTGNGVELGEAELLAARAALAVRRHEVAAARATAAAELFRSQDRAAWAVMGDFVALVSVGATTPSAAATVADALEDAGWALEAVTARTLSGRLAIAGGDPERGVAELDRAAAGRSRGSAAQRLGAWRAHAESCVATGDRRGALRAVRSGLEVVEQHRATLGASDLRAHASAHGAGLAELGVSLALGSGRPEQLLAAAERWRAGSLVAPAVPPHDAVLAELLERFRSVSARRREEPGPTSDRALAAVEAQVRDRTRARASSGDVRAAVPPLVLDDLVARLRDRVLVEWVVHRGHLHAVTVADGRVRATPIGALAPALDAVASVRMCLHRLARGTGSARSLAAAWTTLEASAREAADALLGPLLATLAGRELVLVPTGELHGVPWLALDVVRRAPTVVAPSARAWLAAAGRSRRGGVLLAAGPDLPGAVVEVASLAAALPDAVLLAGDQATVAAVLAGLGSVGVAHLAAHGRFRTDNPQFSSLRFADGELTVYDLEALPHAPDVLVLSACDAASAAVRPGDELLGLSSALLSLGAGSLVAPSVPVPDDVTVAPMVRLQGDLAGGHPARTALWHAVRAWDDAGTGTPDDHRTAAAIRSFVALGA